MFSAILNSNSRIASILLDLKPKHIFYTTDYLLIEIEKHRSKLKKLTLLPDSELTLLTSFIIRQIKFIDVQLIPDEIHQRAKQLTADIDIDDTEFVALAEYLNAKLWTGDKALINGLTQKVGTNLSQQMNCLKFYLKANNHILFLSY